MGTWESLERVTRRAIDDWDMASEIQTWTESRSRQGTEEEKIPEEWKKKKPVDSYLQIERRCAIK